MLTLTPANEWVLERSHPTTSGVRSGRAQVMDPCRNARLDRKTRWFPQMSELPGLDVRRVYELDDPSRRPVTLSLLYTRETVWTVSGQHLPNDRLSPLNLSGLRPSEIANGRGIGSVRWREGETGLDQVLRSPPPLRLVNGMQSMTRCRRQQSHPTRADRQKKDTHQTSPRRGKVKIEDCRWSAAGTRPKRHIASADTNDQLVDHLSQNREKHSIKISAGYQVPEHYWPRYTRSEKRLLP